MTTNRIFVLALALLGLAAAGPLAAQSGHGAHQHHGSAQQGNRSRSMSDLAEHLRKAGLRVGALGGMPTMGTIEVDGRKVEFWRFDPSDAADRAALDDVRAKGAVVVGDLRAPAIVNDAWILITPQDHPQRRQIEAAFRSF